MTKHEDDRTAPLPPVSDTRAAPSNEEIARVARMDLWSEAELSVLCTGILPDAPNRTNDELIAINSAREAIARGTLSGMLSFVSRDDVDSAARMYGTARHYVPSIAAEWAARRFDTFPESLLVAVRERALSMPTAPATRWPWGDYETTLLRKLADAAEKFWKLYDPSDASTAPTNNDVKKWLIGQGVAERNAQVMATILRAEGLQTGPRK